MNTNQFWNTENIKAVASLWPLALIIFLILFLFVVLVFFLPQTRKFLNSLNNLRLKFWQGEIAVNQPSTTPPKPDVEPNVQEATTSAPKTEEKEEAPSNIKNQPEDDLDSESGMYYYLFTGKLNEAEKVFQKLQLATNDPDERIRREAAYLHERFEKGDLSAQDKLHQLETRLKGVTTSVLGVVKRMDALCYVFSREYEKAVERFKDSADSCVTESGRATSLGFAATYLYKLTKKEDAFRLLKESLNSVQDPQAKVTLLTNMADLYRKEENNFNCVLTLQRALSFQPNSIDLLFKTAYACSEAGFNELAVLHYEKLVQIDFTHSSALNNLGVAFERLQIPSLAVKNYKRAIDIDETLAAANYAYALINVGALDEAEKILTEAKGKKEVHQNVMSALVKLQTVKEEAEEAHTKSLNLANDQYQYLLGFSDATLAANMPQFHLNGKWKSTDSEIISNKVESDTGSLELVWVESKKEKFRFSGKADGLAAKGKIEKWKEPDALSALLNFGVKQEGKFESHGDGYVFLSNNLDTLTIFVQESDEKKHRSMQFHKTSE